MTTIRLTTVLAVAAMISACDSPLEIEDDAGAELRGFEAEDVAEAGGLCGDIDFSRYTGVSDATCEGLTGCNPGYEFAHEVVDTNGFQHSFVETTPTSTFEFIESPGLIRWAVWFNDGAGGCEDRMVAHVVRNLPASLDCTVTPDDPECLGCSSNADCGAGFCEFPVATCGGIGECVVPSGGCVDVWAPVTGCDGIVYPSDCMRQQAEISAASEEEW